LGDKEPEEYDLLAAMTIKSIPLHKREASERYKHNDWQVFSHPFEPVWEGVERPTSALLNKIRSTSAKPLDIHALKGVRKLETLKNRGIRLQPINNTINFSFQEMNHVSRSQWSSRPATSYGKRLPPITQTRHVAFDQNSDTLESMKTDKYPAQISGMHSDMIKRLAASPYHSRALRPQTALSERAILTLIGKKKPGFGNERELNPLVGVRSNTNRSVIRDTRRNWQ
jgi:hypothetical protein